MIYVSRPWAGTIRITSNNPVLEKRRAGRGAADSRDRECLLGTQTYAQDCPSLLSDCKSRLRVSSCTVFCTLREPKMAQPPDFFPGPLPHQQLALVVLGVDMSSPTAARRPFPPPLLHKLCIDYNHSLVISKDRPGWEAKRRQSLAAVFVNKGQLNRVPATIQTIYGTHMCG